MGDAPARVIAGSAARWDVRDVIRLLTVGAPAVLLWLTAPAAAATKVDFGPISHTGWGSPMASIVAGLLAARG